MVRTQMPLSLRWSLVVFSTTLPRICYGNPYGPYHDGGSGSTGAGGGSEEGAGGRLNEATGGWTGPDRILILLYCVGGLYVKRKLTSCDLNIRRIGSLQSHIGIPAAEVICVAAIKVCDGLFWLDESIEGSSSKYHRFGISWMAASTMLSPSSFPQTSNKASEREKSH